MSDWTVAELAEDFKAGRVTRRQFIGRMLSVGLTMPVIASVLAACGSSSNNTTNKGAPSNAGATATRAAGGVATPGGPTRNAFQPTKRGGGGTLKVLYWQAPTILNEHFSSGTKDDEASAIFCEPLAYWGIDANLYPVLAEEIPSVEKGTLDKDGKSVTWKLKKGVQWHDGQPFTADDVVFTWQFASDPAAAATTAGAFTNVDRMEKIDDNTVRIVFKDPTPYWQGASFVSGYYILPKHVMEPYKGVNGRNAPFNLKPVGTGPYKVVDFKPGDSIIAEINPTYHVPNRPFFDRFELKGGGDAPSAARAVLQTGDYDFAWNIQVDDGELKGYEKAGIGRVVFDPGSSTEQVTLNPTDPNTEVDGERSSLKTKHPFFSDPAVRKAFALAINRRGVSDQLYGRGGSAATYQVFNPEKFVPSPASTWEYNLQKAGQMLDDAGWKKGADGIRAKNGVKMKVLYQTSVNTVRQNTQQIIKKDLESIGIQVELKSVDSGIFFGGDPGNPDNLNHFYADMQMYTTGPGPDPGNFMRRWASSVNGGDGLDNVAQKANNWSKSDVFRYVNPEYNKLWFQQQREFDPIKRADLFKKMNQMIIDDVIVIPIVNRRGVSVAKNNVQGMDLTPWDVNLSTLPYWYRKT